MPPAAGAHGQSRPTVSINQAAAVVGVTRRTIYCGLKSGKLEFKRTAGGSVRIYSDSLWRDHIDRRA